MGELLLDEYEKLLNEKTKIVAITHVSNALGTINPVHEMIAAAHEKGIPVLVYEPALPDSEFFGSPVIHDLGEFKSQVDLIVANRITPELHDVQSRVYSRDLFGQD